MPKVLLEMTVSLDGNVAGPGVSPEEPMGRGGEQLHDWMFEGRSSAEIEQFQSDLFRGIGAVIMGRRMADLGIGNWGEEPAYHAPVFVVTNRPAETIVKAGGTSFTFVTSGIDDALRQAREAAGTADVIVMGGAEIARQYLRAGAIEELRLHLAPVILGAGTRLFDDGPSPIVHLRPTEVASSPLATHLTYEVAHVPPVPDRPDGTSSDACLLIRAGRVGRHAQTDPEEGRRNDHHAGLPGRRATPPPTHPSRRARHRRQGQASVDRTPSHPRTAPVPIAIGPELLAEMFA